MSDTETNLQAESEDQSDVNKLQNKIDAEVLQNIPVTISVEVGRTSLKIRD
jgi:flagellar motor switch protein FliN